MGIEVSRFYFKEKDLEGLEKLEFIGIASVSHK